MSNQLLTITRRFEFDSGHRIPNHDSKCRHFHGHRYVAECTFMGLVSELPGASDEGMIIDFGEVKAIVGRIFEFYDHAMLMYADDPYFRTLVETRTNVVALKFIPTAENLARYFIEKINEELAGRMREVKCGKLRLYETPNCYAEITDASWTDAYTKWIEEGLRAVLPKILASGSEEVSEIVEEHFANKQAELKKQLDAIETEIAKDEQSTH